MRKLKLFSLLAVLLCSATMWAATYSSGTVAISDLEPYDCLQEGVTLTGSDGYTLRFSNYKKTDLLQLTPAFPLEVQYLLL